MGVGRKRRPSLHFIHSRRPLPACTFGYFLPGAAIGIVATIDYNSRQEIRGSLLADLASVRADLVAIQADALRNLLAARSALVIATLPGFDPERRKPTLQELYWQSALAQVSNGKDNHRDRGQHAECPNTDQAHGPSKRGDPERDSIGFGNHRAGFRCATRSRTAAVSASEWIAAIN